MPFNTNAVAGTVVHAQSQWNTKLIVANDISFASNTTYTSLLKFDLGKYERAIFRIYLDVQNHADGVDSDSNFSGKIGGSVAATEKLGVYGELAVTAVEDADNTFGTKLGAKYSF